MIKEAARIVKEKLSLKNPQIAVILGSGLGKFTSVLENTTAISYKEIPGFPISTVSGHNGRFVRGFIGNKEIICMDGRVHLYEGHDASSISTIIKVLKELGIKRLIVTNAAGSLKKDLEPGSLMLIKDHINFSGRNPLVGRNDDEYGVRFPPMNNAYPLVLRNKMKTIAKRNNISLKEGVYLMVLGPNFETPAEIKAFGILGADAVGMSTVPEVISAVHCSIDVLGISVITNYGAGLVDNPPSHQETLEMANKSSDNLVKLVKDFILEED